MKSKYEISLPVTVQYIIIKEDEVLGEETSWRNKNKKPKSGGKWLKGISYTLDFLKYIFFLYWLR